eukprot:GSMAST32.ASY1.ANO1.1496.1 assembled CDS
MELWAELEVVNHHYYYYIPPIIIDGVDILTIGLSHVRKCIGIIPQNVVLFSGTIRSNLDPFDQYSDENLWNVLEQCEFLLGLGLKNNLYQILYLTKKYEFFKKYFLRYTYLQMCLNMCVFIMIFFCLYVDFQTDSIIQKTLKEAFGECTVITIAHRVNTIMDSDKILVIENG